MEFTFDVSQTPIIGRRYLKGAQAGVGLSAIGVAAAGQASAGSSTVSSATGDSLREQVG